MTAPARSLRAGGETLELGGRPWLMGIVNATPDSFSDAGLGQTPADRVERARALLAAGAGVIDIGGEAGGTDKPALEPAEELRRVGAGAAAAGGLAQGLRRRGDRAGAAGAARRDAGCGRAWGRGGGAHAPRPRRSGCRRLPGGACGAAGRGHARAGCAPLR